MLVIVWNDILLGVGDFIWNYYSFGHLLLSKLYKSVLNDVRGSVSSSSCSYNPIIIINSIFSDAIF